jgi:peptidoglycan hydrolase CwlO-like protein
MFKKIYIVLAVLIFLNFIVCAVYSAQPKEELKEIKKEIDIHKKKLQETKKLEKNIIEELQKVTKELYEIEKKISAHKEKIKSIQLKIEQTEKEIKIYSNQLENRKKHLSIRIRGIQKLNYQPDPYLLLLTEEDTTRALRIIRNTQKIISIEKKNH